MGCGTSKVTPIRGVAPPAVNPSTIVSDPAEDPPEDDDTPKIVSLSIDVDDSVHHTAQYNEHTALLDYHVVRRGTTVKFACELSGPIKDTTALILKVANKTIGRDPVVVTFVSDPKPTDGLCWSLTPETDRDGSTEFIHTVVLHIPPTFTVGKFTVDMSLSPTLNDGGDVNVNIDVAATHTTHSTHTHASINMVVLFNPWCEADVAFVDDATMKDEYLMNPQGIIFTGMKFSINPFMWSFGQFDPEVMDCVLYLLSNVAREVTDDAFREEATSDIVHLTRRLTSMANANDNGGVLLGSWTGDYNDGATPSSWSSTAAIVSQYMKSMVDESGTAKKAVPVRYGQCFTFAGLLTGILRCLGIAARPISCFGSAHDQRSRVVNNSSSNNNNNNNMQGGYNSRIEKYFNTRGESIEEISEAIWSFHVWTEGWFARADLKGVGTGVYDGWQVLDATPQETSDTWFQCGPAPVTAIKKGETSSELKYDIDFVYGEVNADVYFFHEKTEEEKQKEKEKQQQHPTNDAPSNSEWAVTRIDTTRVAPFLLTKSVGKIDYEGLRKSVAPQFIPNNIPNAVNVMGDYKYPEGSVSERAVQKQAESHLRVSVLKPDLEVVKFDLTASNDSTRWSRPTLGESFNVMLHMELLAIALADDANKELQVSGTIEVYLTPTRGKAQSLVATHTFGPEPLSTKKVLAVEASTYLSMLKTTEFSFEVRAFASVVDHPQTYITTEMVLLESPTIEVEATTTFEVGKETTVSIKFKNPADLVLESVVFKVDGDIIDGNPTIEVGTVVAHGFVERELKFIPHQKGKQALHVRLESFHLNGLIHWDGEFDVVG